MASNLIAAQYAVSLPIATIKAAAVWLIKSYAEAAVAPAPEAAPLDQRDRALDIETRAHCLFAARIPSCLPAGANCSQVLQQPAGVSVQSLRPAFDQAKLRIDRRQLRSRFHRIRLRLKKDDRTHATWIHV